MRRFSILSLIVLLSLSATQIALAQSELVLSINRDFGYGGFDNKIEGLFTLNAESRLDLVSVDFFIDDELIASVDEIPFRIQFSTNSFAPGEHQLYAIGFSSSGEEIRSNEIIRVFITKEETGDAMIGIIVPMLGIILLIMIASAGIPALLGNKESVGQYGILGGTVCPKCRLPFSLKFWGFNWFTGKLQRCPHCGKWSVVRHASTENLAAAEARWRGDEPTQIIEETREQRTRRQIDDSRYDK